MASDEAKRLSAEMLAEKASAPVDLLERRAKIHEEAKTAHFPDGTKVQAVNFAGVDCEWVQHPKSPGDGVLLWIHGGGFVTGNCDTHRNLAAWLSEASGTRVLVPAYRLAPEHPYPAALQDVAGVYGALLRGRFNPESICIGGDSAGGGLALTLALSLLDAKGPLPAGLALISPWVDLTCKQASHDDREDRDPRLKRENLLACTKHYASEFDPAHPMLSPLFGDLKGLPPMLVQVGSDEVLYDDSDKLVEGAKQVGQPAEFKVWDGLWHVFQRWAPEVPEAKEAIAEMGAFIQKQLN